MTLDLSKIEELEDDSAPLLHQYRGQVYPQPAYIELDEDGVVTADYSGEIGNGVPASVWHNRDLRFPIAADLSGAQIKEFMANNKPLLERIHTGHDVEWNGNNYVGTLSDDAERAQEDFTQACQEATGQGNVWRTSDYLFANNSLDAIWSSEATLDRAVEESEQAAKSDGIILVDDVRETMLGQAEHEFRHGTVSRVHIDALLADGRITQDDIDEHKARQKAIARDISNSYRLKHGLPVGSRK